MESWMSKVQELAKQVAERESCILYDLEFVGAGKGRTLRVYIDKESGPVGIDDCSNVSNGLNLLLDVEDIVPGGAYQLEVSTPGLERHLKVPWHFEKVVGKKISVRTRQNFAQYGVSDKRWMFAKSIEATLASLESDSLVFQENGVELKIPVSGVEKAKLVFEIVKGQKKK
jgi:ribosome maturation factor RimP